MEARAERVKLLLARVREHVVHILLHILMSGGRMTAYTHNNVTVAHFIKKKLLKKSVLYKVSPYNRHIIYY